MRKFLFVLVTAIFLYSPYGPTWGRTVVNAGIMLSILGFYAKNIPKRRYR